jgi:hypothetical protein
MQTNFGHQVSACVGRLARDEMFETVLFNHSGMMEDGHGQGRFTHAAGSQYDNPCGSIGGKSIDNIFELGVPPVKYFRGSR